MSKAAKKPAKAPKKSRAKTGGAKQPTKIAGARPVQPVPARNASAPLGQLFVAPENARYGVAPPDVDALAANLAAYGLLQPLVAYEGERAGSYAIVCGARRLAALTRLYTSDFVVPLRVVAQADAHAASLAENTLRVDLSVAAAARAFSRMALDGRETAEIARAFGVTERFVHQRMKLAGLHEQILAAL
ncbi:MAG: ParB/Srx family N-terminal domain-containing protein, partial [Hyphomonadaceae bacterium]|nr:ParB/Srx family N-terminal domain-containing protein [Hyphomonadaceae bacterium]